MPTGARRRSLVTRPPTNPPQPEGDSAGHGAAPAEVGDGLLVVDKPGGWTSHDVVARCRRLCGTRRVGHAGTLDPMATGVLILGVNRATKLLTFLVGADKTYTATIRLGQRTITDDAEGDITATVDTTGLTAAEVSAAVSQLTGPIEQVPSAVSAIKVDGKRSYARVRAGEQVDLPARPVTVHRFDILTLRRADVPAAVVEVDVEVQVSSGTYVRALARDLGEHLGVGGHLTRLRRTQVGPFDLADAATLADLEHQGAANHLVGSAQAAARAFPVRTLSAQEATDLGHGKRLPAEVPGRTEPVAAIGPDGRLVAMLDETGKVARSHAVFPAP